MVKNEGLSLKQQLVQEFVKPQNTALREEAVRPESIKKLRGRHLKELLGQSWGAFRLSTLLN